MCGCGDGYIEVNSFSDEVAGGKALLTVDFSLKNLGCLKVPFSTPQRFEENRQRFKEYIQKRTLQNYKFWIVSSHFLLIQVVLLLLLVFHITGGEGA